MGEFKIIENFNLICMLLSHPNSVSVSVLFESKTKTTMMMMKTIGHIVILGDAVKN